MSDSPLSQADQIAVLRMERDWLLGAWAGATGVPQAEAEAEFLKWSSKWRESEVSTGDYQKQQSGVARGLRELAREERYLAKSATPLEEEGHHHRADLFDRASGALSAPEGEGLTSSGEANSTWSNSELQPAPEGEKPVAQVGAGLSGPPLGPQPFPVEQQPDQVPGGPLREAECVVMDALTMLPPEQARKLVESSSYQAFVAGVRASRSGSVGEDQPEGSVEHVLRAQSTVAMAKRIAELEAQLAAAGGEDQRLTPAQARLLLSKIELSSGIDPPETFAALLALRALAGSVEEDQRETEFQRRARKGGELIDRARREDQRLTPEQWKVVLDAATHYDRRLPQGQGSPEIEAALRALAGSVGEPDG